MEHCHNTVHEDNAMLLRWELDGDGTPYLMPLGLVAEANEVRLLLEVIAYNCLVRHARYFRLQLAGSHLTQRLFGKILVGIERVAWRPT